MADGWAIGGPRRAAGWPRKGRLRGIFKYVCATHTDMGQKTLGVRQTTYDRMVRHKQDGEGFSDLIERLLDLDRPSSRLLAIVGSMGDEEADWMREQVRAGRASDFGRHP